MKETELRELIERIRQQTDITVVIGQYISLDRHNKALCPFHNEMTPSFSVNPKGQYFRCFGCGIGGDVFKFLELYEHKSFMHCKLYPCLLSVDLKIMAYVIEHIAVLPLCSFIPEFFPFPDDLLISFLC